MNPQRESERIEQWLHNGLQRQKPLWSPLEMKCHSLLQRKHKHPWRSLLQLHSFILRHGLEANLYFLTSFIAACFAISAVGHAHRVFDQSSHKGDTYLCNFMIKSLGDHGRCAKSLHLYRNLKKVTSFVPDQVTFLSLAKSCGSGFSVWDGKQLHNHVMKHGFCCDLFVGSAVVDLYAKLGDISSAGKVFDEMPRRSQVTWTSMVCGHARLGDVENAMKYFCEMPEKDPAAHNAMIYGYVKVGDMVSARALFDLMGQRNFTSWTTMISGYCKNSDVYSARILFDSMPERNLPSWNSMIGGYSCNKQPEEAVRLFRELQSNGLFEPNEVTILSILPAIADLGDLDLGCWVHLYVQRKMLDGSSKVRTALLDMFAKCGEMNRAMCIFRGIRARTTASWNAMIYGLAINGRCKEALDLFQEMRDQGFKPDGTTMLVVLAACNHGGLVEEGKRWLKAMNVEFALTPQIEHYGCVIDLLGKAGCLVEAEQQLESMPCEANEITMSSLLFACGYHRDVSRAGKMLKKVVKMEPSNGGNFVCMMNLYAAERRWKDAEEVRGMMSRNRAKKEVGSSVILVDNTVVEFSSGDTK